MKTIIYAIVILGCNAMDYGLHQKYYQATEVGTGNFITYVAHDSTNYKRGDTIRIPMQVPNEQSKH